MERRKFDSLVVASIFKSCFDHLLEILKWLCPDDRPAVDNKGRCALYAYLLRHLLFLLDDLGIFPGIQALAECILIQP